MTDKYYCNYALLLLSGALNSAAPTDPTEPVDWIPFKRFCDRHGISNIVAYQINQLDVHMPEEIKAYFSEIVLQSAAKEARIEIETLNILDSFEKVGIPHMLLKGSVLKYYYPKPDMRSMCDVDILVGNHLDKAMNVMIENRFKLLERAFLHDSYKKKPFVNIELHSSLLDKELKKYYDYFKIGFEKASLQPGYNYRYELSKEDFYIFVLAHFAKHFKRSGAGIRFIADIYVFLSANSEIDFDYINTELEKIGLFKFNLRVIKIAKKWFDELDFSFNDPVEKYIIDSGTYGSSLNVELNKFLQNIDYDNYNKNKFKYFCNTIFPALTYMRERYPSLKKFPVLLPFYWVKRIVYTLLKSKGSIKYRLSKIATSDKSSLDKFSDFN